jgi:hypothetical protein
VVLDPPQLLPGPFEAHLAGVPEHDFAVGFEVFAQ